MSQLTLTEGHWLSIKCSPRNSDLEVFPFLTSGSNGENLSSKMILSSIQTFRNIRQDTKSELPCRWAALKTCWVSSLWDTVLVCAISLDCSKDPPPNTTDEKRKTSCSFTIKHSLPHTETRAPTPLLNFEFEFSNCPTPLPQPFWFSPTGLTSLGLHAQQL